MKLVAIVGSPRKGGNTDVLVAAVLEAARASGAEVERVYLADQTIAPCDACDACLRSGECVIQDDMTPLYDKLIAADTWVLGTPVYWWGPSAQLKAFVDRWYCFSQDTSRISGKRAALVCPFGDADPGTARHVVGMLTDSFNYLGIEFVDQLLVTANAPGEVASSSAVMEKARQLGQRLASRF